MTININDVLTRLRELIAFESVSAQPNTPVVEHLAAHFRTHDADEVTILPAKEPGKANLIVRYGAENQPGIVLSGHTDVVPVRESDWSFPPYEMTIHEGRAYGRGTTDMKGFLACLMALASAFASRPSKAPTLWLAFSHDEEVGCLGAPALAHNLAARPMPPALAIIGEPSNLKMFNGHKGKTAWRIDIQGVGGHSSNAPSHVNAVEAAALVVEIIRKEATKLALRGPFDYGFSVPHPTMPVTLINGGLGTNLTPDRCSLTYERRILSLSDEARARRELEERIRRTVHEEFGSDLHLSWQEVFSYPPMGDASDSAGYKAFSKILPPLSGKVAYGSDGGVFEKVGGIPSVICGPGSIKQAHIADEFVELSELEATLPFLQAVMMADTHLLNPDTV